MYQGLLNNPHVLADTTKYENGMIPPPRTIRSGPGPSAALLPCRSKAQELRAALSSNSLRFLTTARVNALIAFSSDPAGSDGRWGLCCRYFEAAFSYKKEVKKWLKEMALS